AWKAPHHLHVLRQLVDEEALAVAVRVADDDVGRPAFADGGDGGADLAGHPLTSTRILEPFWPELRGLDDAGDAFHVGGNENLAGSRLGGSKNREAQQSSEQTSHVGDCSSATHASPPLSSRLGTLCDDEIETGDEDAPLWSGTCADVPLVANADLSMNRLEQDGCFRSESVHSIARPAKHRWQVRSPVVAHLPEPKARESDFRQLSEQLC